MTLLKPATNQMAFAKIGIFGFGGSGKSRTAAEIMIGLKDYLKTDKPLGFVETETGSDFLIEYFKKYDINLLRMKTRAFKNLNPIIKEAEEKCYGLIIDSLSHFWDDLMESYRKKLNRKRLLFHDWNIIKPEWQTYYNNYMNSNLHIITCGRAAWDYNYFEDESGHKELEKQGTKMKAEKEFTYEPCLVVEMELKHIEATIGSNLINIAHVLKDKNPINSLNGKSFEMPTFKEFKPFFDNLNINGEHFGNDTETDSQDLFNKNGDTDYSMRKKQKDIKLEEIENALSIAFPRDKNSRAIIAEHVFGTTSWIAITQKSLEELDAGHSALVDILNDDETIQLCLNSTKHKNDKELGA